MARQKMKTYVVFCRKRPGIYSNWPECNEQVHRWRGSLYQSFEDPSEARQAWEEYWARHYRGEEHIHGVRSSEAFNLAAIPNGVDYESNRLPGSYATSQTQTSISHSAVPTPVDPGNEPGSTNQSGEASHGPSHMLCLIFVLAGLLMIYLAILRN
ncbi:hypothetical protein PIB30_061022 [Stylosanthes scabra]|uniref:Ribonuclease H1 N-terminal domain-containing protein n=1 Tax=Stylosanthes scabra TaxID=79078 RepID=A0ABU6VK90_9FABA|nr:hypothetical protein [Stylosanthes scabra]